jgi:hypothetical protein
MNTYSDMRRPGVGEWLLKTLTKNPEGLLLLGAGCALLLRGGQRSQAHPGFQAHQPKNTSGQSNARDWAQEASRVADTAREYASSAGKSVSDTAADYAATVTEYAEGARQKVVEQSRRMADHAQSRVQDLVQEQPLAVALAGLAAGAAIATAFPATRWERRTLAPAGRRISEAARTARDKVSEAASAAGERLKSAAQERGLNTEGLKAVAREVAGAMSGDQQSEHSVGRDRGAVSGTSSSGTSGSASGDPARAPQSGMSSSSTPNRSGTNKPGQP